MDDICYETGLLSFKDEKYFILKALTVGIFWLTISVLLIIIILKIQNIKVLKFAEESSFKNTARLALQFYLVKKNIDMTRIYCTVKIF